MLKLPIKLNSYVMSECWTFYKFAIMQTHPNYLEWLAGHMRLVMFDNFESYFGDRFGVFPLEYFNDILQYEDVNLHSFMPDDIIAIIKKELDNGNYVVFDCNFNGMFSAPVLGAHDIHETLLYGYDDDDCVMYSAILNGGIFIESQFSYDLIIKGYKATLKYFQEKPTEIFYRRGWNYPVMRIKLKKELYCFDSLFNFIHKLDNELIGGKCSRKYLNDEGLEEERTYYYGNDIIGAIADLSSNSLKNDISFFDINSGRVQTALVKLYEHEKMILDSVKWAYEKMNISTENSEKLYKQYFDVAESLQRLYLLCIKYRMKPREKTLMSFCNKIQECMVKRRKILKKLIKFLKDEYVKYVSIGI